METEIGVMQPYGMPTVARRRKKQRRNLLQRLQKECRPADTLIWGSWPPELLKNKFLLFKTIQFVIICYIMLWKLTE
jgi:hypothetical protein